MGIDKLEAMSRGGDGSSCVIVRSPVGKLRIFECYSIVRIGKKTALFVEKVGNSNRGLPRLVLVEDVGADFLAKLPLPGEIQPEVPSMDNFDSRIQEALNILDGSQSDQRRNWVNGVIACIDQSELPESETADLTDIFQSPLLCRAYEILEARK